jgi:hypothetical protein
MFEPKRLRNPASGYCQTGGIGILPMLFMGKMPMPPVPVVSAR